MGSYEGDKALLTKIELEIQMAKEAILNPAPSTQKTTQDIYNLRTEDKNEKYESAITKEEDQVKITGTEYTSMVGSNYLSELNKFFLIY